MVGYILNRIIFYSKYPKYSRDNCQIIRHKFSQGCHLTSVSLFSQASDSSNAE